MLKITVNTSVGQFATHPNLWGLALYQATIYGISQRILVLDTTKLYLTFLH